MVKLETISSGGITNMNSTYKFNVIYTLLLIGFFNVSGIAFLNNIGFVAILLNLIIGTLFSFLAIIKTGKIRAWMLIIVVLFIFWATIIVILNPKNISLELVKFITMSLSLVSFMYATSIIINADNIKLNYYHLANLIYSIIVYVSIYLDKLGVSILYKNPASLAYISFQLISLSLLFKLSISRKCNWHWILIPALIISNGRNQMLGLLIVLLVYCIWRIVSKNKFRFILFCLSNFAIISLISYYYPRLKDINFIRQLDLYMLQVFNKRLFSGRDYIWENILIHTQEKKWTGLGHQVKYADIGYLELSAHNQYLQIYMKNGIVGLLIAFVILYLIWLSFYKYRDSVVTRFSASYYIAYLYINIFSVSLFENLMMSATFAWLIFGMGLSKSNKGRISFESAKY